MRLDQAIAARFPDVSRRKARELLAAHRVLVNERQVSIASREIAEGDRIAIVEARPEIAILALSDEWVAVDKPPGIAVQPGREREQRSLVELLQVQLKRAGEKGELFVVHRIDTQTSGVVVFARTRAGAARLSALFAERSIAKTYAAVVEGSIVKELTIDAPIEGRDALTIVRPLEPRNGTTLIEAEIRTGRTHQIRIHLSSAGHPIVGDRRYGATRAAKRMLLHAWKLSHPSLAELEAPLPDDIRG